MVRVNGLPLHNAILAFEQARGLVLLESEPESAAIVRLLARSRCSAYDLEFVALAQTLGALLVTHDKQVLAEFPDVAVSPEAFAA